MPKILTLLGALLVIASSLIIFVRSQLKKQIVNLEYEKTKLLDKAKSFLSKKDKVMKKLINSYRDGALVTRNDVFFHYKKVLLASR